MIFVNDILDTSKSNVKVSHNGFAIFKDVKIANSGNIQE